MTDHSRPVFGRSDLCQEILRDLSMVRSEMLVQSDAALQCLAKVHPTYRESAQNLLHYLSLRRHDLRPLQSRLATMGLSSLGRAESHVLATIDSVLNVLRQLAGEEAVEPTEPQIDFAEGRRLLTEHTDALFGPSPSGRNVRIMVTMPSEAASDYALVQGLVCQGMDCMRINCAHDDAEVWQQMIENLRRAERVTGRKCRVVMDLGGPKLRTGPLEPGPDVVRIRPNRDTFGRVVAPARVWLHAQGASAPTPCDASIPVSKELLALAKPGDRIKFTDARAAKRSLIVAEVAEHGLWGEAHETAYVTSGIPLFLASSTPEEEVPRTRVGELPPQESAIVLHEGDMLVLTRDRRPGSAATFDDAGRQQTPPRIGCTIPGVFDDVRPGESIWFDDGKIGGRIEAVDSDHVLVKIVHAKPTGDKLRSDKGINLPDSNLRLPALTEKDINDLAFVARNADVVELSFANTAKDVESLQRHLAELGSRQPAIVLKIETRSGFVHLPEMVLTAMRSPCCGVMIARGDLAVECGFERLAEVQEEILWVCEAAHVPVIWATQVLETLAKEGRPSRAEVTDAAMGHRAECVMLNKGPHILSAVRVLDDILRRMEAHQAKKRSMLRELRLAHALGSYPSG